MISVKGSGLYIDLLQKRMVILWDRGAQPARDVSFEAERRAPKKDYSGAPFLTMESYSALSTG